MGEPKECQRDVINWAVTHSVTSSKRASSIGIIKTECLCRFQIDRKL
jgi:hypothetical protein